MKSEDINIQNVPCYQCITLPICKSYVCNIANGKLTFLNKIRKFHIYSNYLSKKCKFFSDYLTKMDAISDCTKEYRVRRTCLEKVFGIWENKSNQ